MNGIIDYLFGDRQPHGYGLYAENVYLKGEFVLNNGKTVVEFLNDSITLAVRDEIETSLSV